MGDLATDTIAGMTHRPAKSVDRFLGHEALESRDFPACLLIGKTVAHKNQA